MKKAAAALNYESAAAFLRFIINAYWTKVVYEQTLFKNNGETTRFFVKKPRCFR